MNWRCWFGHRWNQTGNRTRDCFRCGQHQMLFFYSNRTQDWVNVKEPS